MTTSSDENRYIQYHRNRLRVKTINTHEINEY